MRDLLAFPDESRVWIYQSNKNLPTDQIGLLNEKIEQFAKDWTSHNKQLNATGGLLHDTFVILVADESRAGASGCSIDTSVRFVTDLGKTYGVDFFDRLTFAFLDQESVHRVHRDDLKELHASGQVHDGTLFFDNLVKNKSEFLTRWVTPLGDSWIRRFI